MTPRIVVLGELRAHGREVEIIVKPRWTHADLDAAESLQGAPVRITIEPVDASERAPEPLTGGPADINVRVRIKRDWSAGSFMAGQTGTLIEHTVDDHTVVRLDGRGFFTIPTARLERTDECPCCGRGPS